MYIFMIFIKNLTLSNFQFSKYFQSQIHQDHCLRMEWLIWTQEAQERLLTQKFSLSQVKILKSRLVQEVVPNQEVEILVHIHFPTIECDSLRLVIQVQEWKVWEPKLTLKCCSIWVTKLESILIQEFELDHKFKNLGHILVWVQFLKNENLPIY